MKIDDSIAAVVTGGASGLGEATARALAARGARVAIFDMNADLGERVAKDIGGVFCGCDVSNAASVTEAFETARAAHGQERVTVCCAGIAPAQKTVSKGRAHDPAMFAKVVGVNLIGTFNCMSQSAAGMSAVEPLGPDGERGVIVNTASVAAFEGQIGQVAYASSKGGVVGMTLPAARDLSNMGIRVCAIAPGLFLTPLMKSLPQDLQDSLGRQVPFPSRLGAPSEFAELAVHIAENPMLNGEVIRLDGAIRMSPK